MKTNKGLSRREFENKFRTNEDCASFLSSQKWKNGFYCSKCHHTEYYKGKKGLNRRCKSCGYEESPTAHTVFHKLKFDLWKAFGMIFEIMSSTKGANSIWLADTYEVSQNTAWLFRRKIQEYLKSSKTNPLTGEVHVDEFEIGTPQKGEQGRSNSLKKMRVVIATEIRGKKVGNAYAQVIEDFSAKSLKRIFNDHVATDALVKTDGWSGYTPLKNIYKKLTQIESSNGTNFPEIHIQIRNLKNWIRGTHSFCEKQNLQDYLNEYFYRFNRRNFKQSVINNLFDRFLKMKTLTYKELIKFET